MAEEVQGEAVEQSTVLSEAEVNEAVSSDEVSNEEVVLPSDEASFEMPDKFQGKSAEEIAKAYLELEKMKQKNDYTSITDEDIDAILNEEPKEDDTEGGGPKNFDKYLDSFLANNGLSEQEYQELSEQGYSKDQVDEQLEFYQFKVNKQQEQILNGIPKDTYMEAAVKAQETWGEEKVKEYNNDLANASLHVQQLMAKMLVQEFSDGANATENIALHTNEVQKQPSKGYSNRSELLKDISDPRYESDRAFNQAVEAKLAMTDDSGW